VANAQPSEWLLRQGSLGAPYGVIRRFAFGDPNKPDVWFRVVTWAQSSAERELIGWCRTLEAAAAAAWDHRRATESWRHHLASRRVDAATMAAQRPSAAELVRFYRAALRRDASTASRSSKMAPTRPAALSVPAPTSAPPASVRPASAPPASAPGAPGAPGAPAQSARASATTRSR